MPYSENCTNCSEVIDTNELRYVDGCGRWCPNCIENLAATCEECGDYFRFSEPWVILCVSCENYHSDDDDDDDDDEGSAYIHGYSYKPSPIFHTGTNTHRTAKPGLVYMGMELEITSDSPNRDAETLTNAANGLIYCKEDSSVHGLEAVTHPMTLNGAKKRLPWDTFSDLSDEGRSAEENGIHVHVARSSFDNNAHVYRWIKLIYRNEAAVTRLARRDPSEWASFTSMRRADQKYIRKYGTANRVAVGRYSAVNILNEHTFEVRVFQGSLDKTIILSTLEFVHASVEYTRQLRANDVIMRKGWNWVAFINWAKEQGATYANLIDIDSQELQQHADDWEDNANRLRYSWESPPTVPMPYHATNRHTHGPTLQADSPAGEDPSAPFSPGDAVVAIPEREYYADLHGEDSITVNTSCRTGFRCTLCDACASPDYHHNQNYERIDDLEYTPQRQTFFQVGWWLELSDEIDDHSSVNTHGLDYLQVRSITEGFGHRQQFECTHHGCTPGYHYAWRYNFHSQIAPESANIIQPNESDIGA